MKFLIIFLSLVTLLLSCAPDTDGNNTSIFQFALSGEPDTLDPHATTGTLTFQVLRSVYETLLEVDEDGSLSMSLAESIEYSEDRKEIKISLRKNVYFHNGQMLSSRDVKASLERLLDPDFASPSAGEYREISAITIFDEHNLQIDLKQATVPFLSTLASGWSAILPADLIESGHEFARAPVGTGPFEFSEWVQGVSIIFEKNDEYWDLDRPHFQTLQFDILSDTTLRTQAFIDGDVQGIDLIVEPELSRLRELPSVAIEQSLSSLVLVIPLNHRRDILQDIEFRSAIDAAIDKQQVMEHAYGGGEVIGSFMDPMNAYYADFTSLRSYDPDYAAEVFARKQPSRKLIMSVPQNFEPHKKAAEMYQDMLAKVGLEIDIELLEWSRWISSVYREFQFDMTVIGHTGKLDPDAHFSAYGSDETYVGWINTAATDLIDRARVEFDNATRSMLYEELQLLMAKELPFIFIGTPYRYVGVQKGIQGLKIDPVLDSYDFRDVTIQ